MDSEDRSDIQSLIARSSRKIRITSRDDPPVIDRIGWKKTILDVRTENVAIYCADVTEWAASALEAAQQIDVVA